MINKGLELLLSNLTFNDAILIYNVSRLTRIDTKSKDFKRLVTVLFSFGRSVFIYDKGKPLQITKEHFIVDAKESYRWYMVQKDLSKAGNEVKRGIKELRIDKCLILHNLSMLTVKQIAQEIGVKERQIYRYKAYLRKEGYITKKPQFNGKNAVKLKSSLLKGNELLMT